MNQNFDAATLHRTAKYFMDSGRADSPEAAMKVLQGFGMSILGGEGMAASADQQVALLTLVNIAARTFLAGVEVANIPDAPCICPLAPGQNLREAVVRLGGRIADRPHEGWPVALIGTPERDLPKEASWFLSWNRWGGGVIPARDLRGTPPMSGIAIAPVLAAAICASEVFTYQTHDHPLAGRRSQGLNLWALGRDWMDDSENIPRLEFGPSALWLIGLGNLGQAYAWTLGCLPYAKPGEVEIFLQDVDAVSAANVSTSVLSFPADVGTEKTRLVAAWLQERGFKARIVERRFGRWTQRTEGEPGVGLCGVDNALARAELEEAGFGLVVEAGLGAGPEGFRSIVLHSFPAKRSAEETWRKQVGQETAPDTSKPAYESLRRKGMHTCGLAQLAMRTVAVPFTGITAAALVVAELLRRLHGGNGTEVASTSMSSLTDVEAIMMNAPVYSFGHTGIKSPAV